jgi:hypothetical protein
LALPLQAFAAASMLFCGRVTHETWLLQVATALSYHDTDQSPLAAHDNERDHHDGFVGHHHDGDHDQVKHLADSCSACSDCCCPTVLASAKPPGAAIVGTLAWRIPSATQPIPDSTPDRLDRPPRNTLV